MSRKKQSQNTVNNSNLIKVAELGGVKPGDRKVVLVNGIEIPLFNLNGRGSML